MTTFLLLLSLILNAAAIFAIILLYLRQNRLVEAEKKQERIIGEIEEVFSSYLLEMKEENEKFLENIKTANNDRKIGIELDSPPNNSPDKEQKEEIPPRIGKGISYHAAKKAYKQNSDKSKLKEDGAESDLEEDLLIIDDSSELQQLSFVDRVIYLKNKGYSVDEIARDLNKGRTEIELLLKFRQNP